MNCQPATIARTAPRDSPARLLTGFMLEAVMTNTRTARPSLYVPCSGPPSWQALLADPVKHWRPGFSAHALAACWEESAGLPAEIAASFTNAALAGPELLLGIPEWKTALPDGLRASQNDLFALVRAGGRSFAVTIEGKVNEAFGPTVSEWLDNPSPARPKRLSDLCEALGVSTDLSGDLRYQLFHRTASAVLEAQRFGTGAAAMIVHSFSPDHRWFEDFAAFAACLGIPDIQRGTLYASPAPSRVPLYIGWAQGRIAVLTPRAVMDFVLTLVRTGKPKPAKDMADFLGIEEKSVRNAIDTLRAEGEPIWHDSRSEGFWWRDDRSPGEVKYQRWKRDFVD